MKITVLNYRELKREYVKKRAREEKNIKCRKARETAKKDAIDVYLASLTGN